MFPKNAFLAVVGADDDFWLCRVARKVENSPRLAKVGFDVHWLERSSKGANIYNASPTANGIERKSVVTRVYLKRRKDGSFELSDAQRRRVERCLSKMAEGEGPTFQNGINGFDIEEMEDDEEEERNIDKKAKTASTKAKAPFYPFKRKEPRRKPLSTTKKSKAVKAITVTKAKGKRATALKSPKNPKVANSPKIPRPPNWRLKENSKVDVEYEDPYFESKRADQNTPFVSSVVQSKLIFNAVHNSDITQLKKICEDVKRVHTLEPVKSMADESTPLEFAVKTNKVSCVKELLRQLQNKTRRQRAVAAPTCMMKSVGTGKYNYRSLGIKKIRRLNMSRGGREGNNALVKDSRQVTLKLPPKNPTKSYLIPENLM